MDLHRALRSSSGLVAAALTIATIAPSAARAQDVSTAASPTPTVGSTTLAALTLTPPTSVLTRLDLAQLVVSAHLVDPEGVSVVTAADGRPCPCADLVPADQPYPSSFTQTESVRRVALTLVSGTAQDGVWEGSTTVGSASGVAWGVNDLTAGDIGKDTPFFPADELTSPPRAVVRTADPLRLTLSVPTGVKVGRRTVLQGTAKYAGSGEPAAGLRLEVRRSRTRDSNQMVDVGPVRTDGHGRWTLKTASAFATWQVAWVPDLYSEPVNQFSLLGGRVRRIAVSAVPARKAVRHGTDVAVRVTDSPRSISSYAVLQRWTGRAWARVGLDRSRDTAGHFGLVATPPRAGKWRYRVVVGASGARSSGLLTGTSRVFVIRAR